MKDKSINIIILIIVSIIFIVKLPIIKDDIKRLKLKIESKRKAEYIYNQLKLKERIWKELKGGENEEM